MDYFYNIRLETIQSFSVILGTIIVTVTAFLSYRKLRQASRSLQFSALNRLQELMDTFRKEREHLYNNFPSELVMSDEQFAKKPPSRHSYPSRSEEEGPSPLNQEQKNALKSLSEEQFRKAYIIINKLNDIGHLVEDKFIPKQVFFGKYYITVIRCCHMIEPVRRKIEEDMWGGSYGHRLLRIRKRAIIYNDIHPKHRKSTIYIKSNSERINVYKSDKRSIIEYLTYPIRRWFEIY